MRCARNVARSFFPWSRSLPSFDLATFAGVSIPCERLLLRPIAPSDAADIFRLYSDGDVMRYWSRPPCQDVAEAQELVDRCHDRNAQGITMSLGVVRLADDVVIGTCNLHNMNRICRRAEVGYMLDRNCWGQGYMTEALSCLFDFAFGELGLIRIEADIDPRNSASAALLERLGFEKEGFLRRRWIVGDEITDSALYGLLAEDWQARRAAG